MSVEIADAVRRDRERNYWYTNEEAIFCPSLPNMREFDAVDKYIAHGWKPSTPLIDTETRTTVFGSCFATMLTKHLKKIAFDSGLNISSDTQTINFNETLVTTFALRQLFEWHFENIKPSLEILKDNRALEINFSDALWGKTLDRIGSTDVFVFLVSSSEIWYDEPTGSVLWREVPGANPARQKFRTSSIEENLDNIRVIYRLMRKYRPHAKMVWALSPVPMIATYRPTSLITANMASKAALRAVIDEVYREFGDDGHFFYWPLYDIVFEGFGANPYGGHFNGDRRHINDAVLNYTLHVFEDHYCRTGNSNSSLLKAYVDAKIETQELPRELAGAADRRDRRALAQMINRFELLDDPPTADLITRYVAESMEPEDRGADQNAAWAGIDLDWQILPSLERVGTAPQTLPIPPVAWDYGASSAPLQANAPKDLLVRVTLKVLEGTAGVILIRPDGSALTDYDRRVAPEDGQTVVELRIYPEDGPAHILLRNYDSPDISGMVEVQHVATREAWPAPPASKRVVA